MTSFFCVNTITNPQTLKGKSFRQGWTYKKLIPYYLHSLKKVDKEDLKEDYGKNKYKLHYIYREFTMDFFRMDLNSLRKTSQALKDLCNITIENYFSVPNPIKSCLFSQFHYTSLHNSCKLILLYLNCEEK